MEEDGFFEAGEEEDVVRHKRKKKVLISGDIEEDQHKLNKRYKRKKFWSI